MNISDSINIFFRGPLKVDSTRSSDSTILVVVENALDVVFWFFSPESKAYSVHCSKGRITDGNKTTGLCMNHNCMRCHLKLHDKEKKKGTKRKVQRFNVSGDLLLVGNYINVKEKDKAVLEYYMGDCRVAVAFRVPEKYSLLREVFVKNDMAKKCHHESVNLSRFRKVDLTVERVSNTAPAFV
ncbi:MAG: hypothetical protein ABW168_07345 [Sedimenticola sp.]